MTDERVARCDWAEGISDAYVLYHDREWGVPVTDDRTQFEFLVLESAQAGLSWSTILNKREGYRRNFAGFDAESVARFTPEDVDTILSDPGIVRNRRKVEAAVTNARAFLSVQEEFDGFVNYIWRFVGGRPVQNRPATMSDVPATSPESDALGKDMKKRGFRFVGSTTLYAHMQATGMVNDHLVSCFRHEPCARMADRVHFPGH